MDVRRRPRIVRTLKKIHEYISDFVKAARLASKSTELIRVVAHKDAINNALPRISKNVEVHREKHFDDIVNMGLLHEDIEKGDKIIHAAAEIAEAYGIHRRNQNASLSEELLNHVKHIVEIHRTLPEKKRHEAAYELVISLARVAKEIKELDPNEEHEIIVRALRAARTIKDNTSPETTYAMYLKRLKKMEELISQYRRGVNISELAQKHIMEWGARS